MKDIADRTDIETLVNEFYTKVRKDNILGEIFEEVIQEKWPEHLEKMYRFWETVLLNNHTYHGSPFMPHAKLPIGKKHFERWLELFNETISENFAGEVADEAKWRAEKMAELFQFKIEHIQNLENDNY